MKTITSLYDRLRAAITNACYDEDMYLDDYADDAIDNLVEYLCNKKEEQES